MASISGEKLVLRVQQHSSGTVNAVIAATTSINGDMNAEPLDATSQDSGVSAEFQGGKLTGTISGDFLLASTGEQYDNLYNHMASAETIEWVLYRDGSVFLNGTCVVSSLGTVGGNSDTLTTGSYSLTCEADSESGPLYGPELLPNNTFASWTGDDPDLWYPAAEDASNYVTEASPGAQMVASSAAFYMYAQNIGTAGNTYRITIVTSANSGAGIYAYMGGSGSRCTANGVGTYIADVTFTNSSFYVQAGGATDTTITSISCKQIL